MDFPLQNGVPENTDEMSGCSSANKRGLSMVDWVINTAALKRWWLPDNLHMCNSVIYGDDCRMSVIRAKDYRTLESFTVKLSNPQWEEICHIFVEKAERKYPRNILKHADARNIRNRHRSGF